MAEHPDLEAVEFLVIDPNGKLRGKWAPISSLEKAFQDGINFPLSLHGLDVWGSEVEETGLHIETGDLDGFYRAVPKRLAIVPWAARKTAQVLLETYTPEGEVFACDTRQNLKRIVKQFEIAGLRPVVAMELEFFLLEEELDDTSQPIPVGADSEFSPQDMYSTAALDSRATFFEDVRNAAELQDVPIDTCVKEAAPGQFEVNLSHRTDALAAADDAILLKRIVEACARKNNMRASFMAKPFLEEAGSGLHVHISLLDENDENIFAKHDGRKKLEGAVAELLAAMPSTVLGYINTVNGFRRMATGSYAPTQVVWGENNRSVAIRIPASSEKNLRLEHRISGADANPYIVLSLLLDAILAGVRKLETPPEPILGNAYEMDVEHLEARMLDAITLFEESLFAKRALGEKLHHVYCALKRSEIGKMRQVISPLEYKSYL